MGNPRREAAMTPATTMMAYSMSKTVTAIAVLQLVEAGRVGLDDAVGQYVEALPYGPSVTIRRLLAHTSGLPNPIPLRWVHPASAHAAFDEDAALAAIVRARPRVTAIPGSRYRYSNIGYWLLGKVVERVTGEPFRSYVDLHIVRPLGLQPNELGYTIVDLSLHACGYLEKYSFFNLLKGFLIDRDLIGQYSGRWLEIRPHYLNGPAFGGLVGTASAFGRLLQDQLRDRSVLLGDEGRRLLYSAQATTDGKPVPMTLGWHIGTSNGSRFFFKEGGGGGFHSMMRLYPDRGLGAVVMANSTGFNVRQFLDETDTNANLDPASR
jgi:D-alanyl-D-alanine carboxypeptidase